MGVNSKSKQQEESKNPKNCKKKLNVRKSSASLFNDDKYGLDNYFENIPIISNTDWSFWNIQWKL